MTPPIINPATLTEEQREEWRDVPGYEDLYQVSNFGRMKHKATKAIGGSGYCDKDEYLLKPTKNKGGYYRIALSKKDVFRSFLVHRLVALAFIPNPHNYKCVNHKNCVRDDNRVENLEWCTHSYNTRYAFVLGRMCKSPLSGRLMRKVKVIRLCDEKEFMFETMLEASRFIGVTSPTIRYHVSKGESFCNGFKVINPDLIKEE